MSTKIKAGKKPLSQKRQALINPDEIFNTGLKIPEDVQKHGDKEGYEFRWVDANEMQRNGGQHKRGWIPYIRPKEEVTDTYGFKFGNDPNGLVRRSSLILAWRPKTQGDKHRAYNKQRADQLSGTFRKEAASELREDARNTGLKNIEVLDGYDENESDD